MDANGTRYHLLLGEDDWTGLARSNPPGSASFDGARGELTLRRGEFVFDVRKGDRPPRLDDRRGAACDRYGNLYWIDEDELSIRVQSVGSGTSSLFWRPGLHAARAPSREVGGFAPPPEAGPQPPSPPALRLSGLTVTEDHYLVVGTPEPKGVLVFDLHAPGPPRQELWPAGEDVPFLPFDLCPRAGGGAFVLDREHRRLWELDRHFLVVTRRFAPDDPGRHDFGPADGTALPSPEETRTHWRIALEDAVELGGDPIAIEEAPGGWVLVLDRNEAAPPSTLRLVRPGEAPGPAVPLSEPAFGLEIVGHDLTLVRGRLGTLYVADSKGNQSFALALTLEDGALAAELLHDYFPMRVFGGKALVAGPAGPLYDFGKGWIPLVHQNRPRFDTSSTLEVRPLDGRLPGTVWHRLLLDACIPPESGVRIESRAADDRRELEGSPWQPEPALVYRRSDGPELPFPPSNAPAGYATWEALFQRARGRYLQLRLHLSGDGRTSPRLRALRAYYPRFSYLDRYLPKVYREDPDSASFLDRYLANLEGMQTGVEDRVAAAQVLFDPRTVPAEALDWLIGWFDFAADPTWLEGRRRLFLRHAMDFFALRGTVPGIRLALRLALDACDGEHLFEAETARDHGARIVERFRTRRTPAVVLGDPTELAGPRVVPLQARWDPTQGGDALRDRWRTLVGDGNAEFPLFEASERWRGFVRDVLGVDPPTAVEPALWTQFLTDRYGRIDALNAAYGLVEPDRQYASFADIRVPDELPPDGAALRDWYQFVAVVLPARRTAHRFTVLLPIPPADGTGWTPEERRAIAQRVVELQKPAHTTFDVKFFWAAFRLGEARLGDDTLLDLGSRDPRLRQPLVLGHDHAGESYLGGVPAPTAGHVDRQPLNR